MSPRSAAVRVLMGEGWKSSTIARAVGLSDRQIRRHRERLKREIHNSAATVRRFQRLQAEWLDDAPD